MIQKYTLSILAMAFLLISHSARAQSPNALNFDGTNDLVQTAFQGVLGSANRTFEAWVNINPGATANNAILDYGLNAVGSRNTFYVNSNNQIGFISGGTNANISSSANVVTPGQWAHVAFVLNNGTGFLYVNGSQVGTGNLSTVNTPGGNTALRIGQRVPGGSIPFPGSIDEVRIWNYARTAAEINSTMNDEFCSPPAGLVAYYQMNEGTAGGSNGGVTNLPDLSGGGNNGTLSGFTLSGNTSNWVTGVSLGIYVPNTPVAAMQCDSFMSPSGNAVWYTSGTYADTVLNSFGCDSALTINLSIGNATASTIAASACGSYTSPSGNYTWTTSGTYFDTVMNSSGCDSALTINLSIGSSSTSTISANACESYTSPSGNFTWSTAGTYVDTIPNSGGCDSIITINLSILNTSATVTQSACDSLISPSGNYTWTNSGTYQDTIPNAAGCDSILTVNLTIIGNTSTNTIVENACDSYTSPSGNYTWSTSGIYADTLMSSLGCDSILSIDLTIDVADTSLTLAGNTLTANAQNATYAWWDCDAGQVIAGMTAQSFTASVSGNYALIVTQNGCTDTSACMEVIVVGVEQLSWGSEVSLFPNPTSGLITLDLGQDYENVLVRVMDAEGRMVQSLENIRSSQFQLDLGSATGLFMVQVFIQGEFQTFRVVKTH